MRLLAVHYFCRMKKRYRKKFRTLTAQVNLLARRGLVIDIPAADAEAYLDAANYYRFTGFALPFMQSRTKFLPGSRFSSVKAVCEYDTAVRELLFEGLCAVELAFRALIAKELSHAYGPLGYLDKQNYAKRKDAMGTVRRMLKEYANSRETCAIHLQDKYEDPPIWSLVETVTFGKLSFLYKSLTRQMKKVIADGYGIDGRYFGEYLQHMTVLRNKCAHHSRLYDISLFPPQKPGYMFSFSELREWRKLKGKYKVNLSPKRPIFYQFALVYRMLKRCPGIFFDRDDWKRRVCKCLSALPQTPDANLRLKLGIPPKPDQSFLWV